MERPLIKAHKVSKKPQRGFVMVAVVFVIVVLALAVAFMSRFSGTALAANTKAILGARGEMAALAGLEWGIHHAAATGTCNNASNVTFPNLSSFVVNITCNDENYSGGITVYTITANASFGTLGQPEYIWREFSAVVEQ